MRLAINMPLRDATGAAMTAHGVIERARMAEAAGFSGIWNGDNLPLPGRPDTLTVLAVAAAATESVEIGTCISVIPGRRPTEFASRALTLETLTPGRITLGIGAGSSRQNDFPDDLDFGDRFKLLHENMAKVRGFRDEDVRVPRPTANTQHGAVPATRWAPVGRGPRFILGAWHSEISLKRAVAEYDGWMCSASRTNFNTMSEAIKRYRDLGGKRAMVSTCKIDLSSPTKKITDDDMYYLECQPEDAAERLQRLVDIGFDDVLLIMSDTTNPKPLNEPDYNAEQLEQIRSLLPIDDRLPYA